MPGTYKQEETSGGDLLLDKYLFTTSPLKKSCLPYYKGTLSLSIQRIKEELGRVLLPITVKCITYTNLPTEEKIKPGYTHTPSF